MLEVDGFFGLVVLGFWIWALYDVITSDEAVVRYLPKMIWLLLVIFLFDVGALLWLLIGRPRYAPRWAGTPAAPRGASEDEREVEARRARYAELDAELDRRLEEKQRRLEEDLPPSNGE